MRKARRKYRECGNCEKFKGIQMKDAKVSGKIAQS